LSISIETLLMSKTTILDISGIVCKSSGSFALPGDLESDCLGASHIYLYLIYKYCTICWIIKL
jgi:hypothetical protein